jgi:nucleoside-diphosphate-sugar epimerase
MNAEKNLIGITGASGFVGKGLCSELCKRNILFTKLKITDVSTDSEISNLLSKCSTLVHLAARVHVINDVSKDPLREYRRSNVDLTLNLAHLAVAAGVRRLIYVSSVKVNGESTVNGQRFSAEDIPAPQDPYGISKMEAEEGLRLLSASTGIELVIIRPPLVYGQGVKGNFELLIGAVKKGWPLPFGAVCNNRSLISLGNLVDFIIFCIDHPNAINETFLVCDGQDISTPGLVRGLAQTLGVPARLFPVPLSLLMLSGSIINKSESIERLCGNLQVDVSKAMKMLGWTPPLTVEEGLQKIFLQDLP